MRVNDQDRIKEEDRKPTSQALMNNREVAEYLNVKEATIRHWVHIGYIPHIKFRGLVRFRRETIDAWTNAPSGCAALQKESHRTSWTA